MTLTNLEHAQRPWTLPAAVAIAVGVTLVVCLPFTPGVAGTIGLVLAMAATGALGLATWALLPQAMVVVVPALIPSPMFALTFAWELALVVLALGLALHGVRTRAAWTWRLGPVEALLLAFTAWAWFTYFWSPDLRFYVLGARRMLLGLVSLWVACRLPRVAGRRWFDVGLIAAASALAVSAIHHSLTTGLSGAQALLHRTEVTNLGWGTANYVATLLLLCAPSLLRLAMRATRAERLLAWGAFALVAAVQLIIASRAASVLFLVGTLLQLLRATRRFRVWVVLGFVAVLTTLLVSPLGFGLVSRLGNLRDLGSMTIRIWYFREAWHRVLDHLPWGLGLFQGFANPDRLQGIDPHNYWLLVGGDLGIPGLVLWAAVLVALVRAWWSTRTDEASREQAHTVVLTIALANVHTLVEPTFQGNHYQFLFFWIAGGTLAYAMAERPGGAERRAAAVVAAAPPPVALPPPLAISAHPPER
jgi:hypothetical protein